jgi:CheY-like chemotaxis protein
MRLDFNILWVDDQSANVESQRESIEMAMKGDGFRLQTKFASSVEEAKGFLAENIYGDHIDLILMDQDLGPGVRGDKGLLEVRKIFPYKDMIFYSANSNPNDLTNVILEGGAYVQGVYLSSRLDLPDTVKDVFRGLVKKIVDIEHSRGIVMGATSDIDYDVQDCLAAIFNKSNNVGKDGILKVLKEKHCTEKEKNFTKELRLIKGFSDLSELCNIHNVYTSNDRLRLLKNALEINDNKKKTADIEAYLKKTVPKRNILAHVKVEENGFSRKLISREGKEFTSDDMKALRLELLKYSEFFENLLNDFK